MSAGRRLLMAAMSGGGSFVLPPPTFAPPDVPGSSTTITDNGKYNAWPVICRLQTGDLLLAYTRADSHHQDNTGKAVGRISADEGGTWGTEFDIYDHASLFSTVYGISITPTGRVIAVLWRDDWDDAGTGEAGIVYSDDDGGSWSSWVALTSTFTQEEFGAGPAITTGDGDLLLTVEGTASGAVLNRSSHTLRSTDDGATWGSEVTVRNYAADTRPYYESKLVKMRDDTLRCIHRTAAAPSGAHYVSRSTDGGATWGTPTAAFAGYGAPSTILHSGGGLISTTRRNSDDAAIAYTSMDGGATWSDEIVLDATMFQSEYACPVELLDGTVLVVYGAQPTSSLTNSDIKSVILTGGGETEPPAPEPGDWFDIEDPWLGRPAFGEYTEAPAGQMWISGDQHGAVIEQLTFSNRAAGVNVIVLDHVTNFTLQDIDFDTVPEVIYTNGGCDNSVLIQRLRIRNLYGPFTRTGFHSGNIIQSKNPGPMKVRDIKLVQPDPAPGGYTAWGTEDCFSLSGDTVWGGTSWDEDDALIIERVAIDAGDWQSPSGTGFFVGDGDLDDGAGQYVWIRDVILLNPGQCAFGTGEHGPYRFERCDVEGNHGGENPAFQIRSADVEVGDCNVDWPNSDAVNGDAPAYTDLGGNDFAATLSLSVTL